MAVRRKGQGQHPAGLGQGRQGEPAGSGVVNANACVHAAGGQHLAIRREGQGNNLPIRVGEGGQRLGLLRVPESEAALEVPRGQEAAVGREGEGGDGVAVGAEGDKLVAGAKAPEIIPFPAAQVS